MTKEQIKEYLKENLEISSRTDSVYVGGTEGPLYQDQHTIILSLEGEIISEEYLG